MPEDAQPFVGMKVLVADTGGDLVIVPLPGRPTAASRTLTGAATARSELVGTPGEATERPGRARRRLQKQKTRKPRDLRGFPEWAILGSNQ